jgi:hypothetical protein
LGVDIGDLTSVGLTQCQELGKNLRLRYLDPSNQNFIFNISINYNSRDYKFYSSEYDRTKQSIQSATLGLFPEGTRDYMTGQYALRNGSIVVPIHVIPSKEDMWLTAFDTCTKLLDNFNKFFKSEEIVKVEKENSELLKKIKELTGLNEVNFSKLAQITDAIDVQINHKLLNIKELIDLYPQIKKLNDWVVSKQYSRKVMNTWGGGMIISKIISDMQKAIEMHKSENFKQYQKWIHYSSHDTSLLGIFAALKLSDDYEDFMVGNPHFGSSIVFELHYEPQNPSPYFVKIAFTNGFDGTPKYYTLKSLAGKGCNEKCPFTNFKEICEKDAIPNDWCSECGNYQIDTCLRKLMESKSTQVTFMIIALIGLGVVFLLSIGAIIFLYKKNGNKYKRIEIPMMEDDFLE